MMMNQSFSNNNNNNNNTNNNNDKLLYSLLHTHTKRNSLVMALLLRVVTYPLTKAVLSPLFSFISYYYLSLINFIFNKRHKRSSGSALVASVQTKRSTTQSTDNNIRKESNTDVVVIAHKDPNQCSDSRNNEPDIRNNNNMKARTHANAHAHTHTNQDTTTHTRRMSAQNTLLIFSPSRSSSKTSNNHYSSTFSSRMRRRYLTPKQNRSLSLIRPHTHTHTRRNTTSVKKKRCSQPRYFYRKTSKRSARSVRTLRSAITTNNNNDKENYDSNHLRSGALHDSRRSSGCVLLQ